MTNSQHDSTWRPCPPGTLRSFAQGERSRSRRRTLTTLGSGIAAIVLMVLIGTWAFNQGGVGEPSFGGITCTEVRSHAKEFMSGSLDAETSQQIRVHLQQCAPCQKLLGDMMPVSLRVGSADEHLSRHDCQCHECQNRFVSLLSVLSWFDR
jgi:hypothetical protein